MKKGSKKQSNVTRVLNFFKEGDENEVAAVLILMGPIIDDRHLKISAGMLKQAEQPARRRRRLNGAVPMQTSDVESHKERVAHALASTQGE